VLSGFLKTFQQNDEAIEPAIFMGCPSGHGLRPAFIVMLVAALAVI
jgi:hypothetical protein